MAETTSITDNWSTMQGHSLGLTQTLDEELTEKPTVTITLRQINLVRYFIGLVIAILLSGFYAGQKAMNYEDRLAAIEKYIAKKEAATPAISDAVYVAQSAHYNFHQ